MADSKIPVVNGGPNNGKISGKAYTKVWMKYMEDISSTSSAFEKNTLHQKLFNTIFYVQVVVFSTLLVAVPAIPHLLF